MTETTMTLPSGTTHLKAEAIQAQDGRVVHYRMKKFSVARYGARTGTAAQTWARAQQRQGFSIKMTRVAE